MFFFSIFVIQLCSDWAFVTVDGLFVIFYFYCLLCFVMVVRVLQGFGKVQISKMKPVMPKCCLFYCLFSNTFSLMTVNTAGGPR